ncbi:MAG: winged helix-turn-helix domain-containing protein [archaeon GB-1867-005]|nr:winged helix-turn-helix domain-containing protein [Candidatus Culexmicrobium cathedralense]
MEIKSERELVRLLKALANPLRLRILASLCNEPKSIYTLSRELKKPYPLVHIYLTSLKKLGLIRTVRIEKRAGSLPPIRYYVTEDFQIVINPKLIRKLIRERDEYE